MYGQLECIEKYGSVFLGIGTGSAGNCNAEARNLNNVFDACETSVNQDAISSKGRVQCQSDPSDGDNYLAFDDSVGTC